MMGRRRSVEAPPEGSQFGHITDLVSRPQQIAVPQLLCRGDHLTGDVGAEDLRAIARHGLGHYAEALTDITRGRA
ncbi:hypothetical protein RI138_26095 [Streptomyces sp. C11-1]|uniref:Uncharacterized protein n=1 Tax=Streptomyces durocortorensis TaxID=2811104 RepID=A0ABY9W1I9_9ACTN|nr:hypothetical protein [Streptomyces durocortorensis]WNF30020.1 hypothetical protein RI138_26095 [Streptomyces durocortorensis]